MKRLKIVGFIVGGIVVLAAVLLALAFTPSVQTWAVRKAVAGQPGMTIEVARVDAGLSSAKISDLRFVQNGLVVTAKDISAKYSAWDYISGKKINVDSVAVQDLVVDLRNVKPAATPATPGATPATREATRPANAPSSSASTSEKKAPFEGILKQAQLPFDVRVASLASQGRAMLPD